MLSTIFFYIGTLLLSLNLIRPFGLAISDWFFFASLVIVFISTMIIEKKNISLWTRNRFLWFAFLILVGAILSLVNTQYLSIAIFEIVQQLYVITLFISLTMIMVERGKARVIAIAFILSGVFTTCVAAFDYFTGSSLGLFLSNSTDPLYGRFAGTLGSPNKFGYYLVLTSIITLAQLGNSQKFSIKILWIALFLIQVFGIYLSGSVTAYLGFLFAFAALILVSRQIQKSVLIIFVVLIMMFLVIAIVNNLVGLPASFDNLNFQLDIIPSAIERVQTSTAESRWFIYQQVFDIMAQSPLIGVGFDQISTSSIQIDQRFLEFSVHNGPLQILYVGGLVAFIGYLAIYISLAWISIKTLWKSRNANSITLIAGIASATLAILIMDQFHDAIYTREKWLIVGLLVGLVWINLGDPSQASTENKAEKS